MTTVRSFSMVVPCPPTRFAGWPNAFALVLPSRSFLVAPPRPVAAPRSPAAALRLARGFVYGRRELAGGRTA